MKTQTALSLPMVLMIFGLLIGIHPIKAQNEQTLSGSKLKSEEIAANTDAIFVGEITAIGFGNAKAAGESVYHGVQVKVSQILRGTVDPSITVTLHVAGIMELHEDAPKTGSPYIFFVKKNAPGQPDPYTALKLLPATDANITKVKQLISQATK